MDETQVTTVERQEDRAAVRPYADSPVLEHSPGVVACRFCGNVKFRRSRVRSNDIRELLMLRYPVRCTRCGQRQYTSFGVAGLALPPKPHGPRLAEGNETWRAWTESSRRGKRVRPMSTAAEPRARNIEKPREPMRSPRSNEDEANW